MKKVLTLLTLAGVLTFGISNTTVAQETDSTEVDTSLVDSSTMVSEPVVQEPKLDAPAPVEKTTEEAEITTTQYMKEKFIEGDPKFMVLVLAALILGLALCIERVIYLNMATTNTDKLLNSIESALESGGIEEAKEVCRNTKGPVASIFYQGLDRSSEGIEMVEKSVVAYGSVQMGLLEKGLSWISLFIALAPMLGFLGTVIGMIGAFDAIAAANNIEPKIVAGGIQQALITTVAGLFVAIILQIFYNYIVSKIDGLVNQMEDASISLIDLLIKHGIKK